MHYMPHYQLSDNTNTLYEDAQKYDKIAHKTVWGYMLRDALNYHG